MSAEPFDWSSVRLVAFDVDGTLYSQTPVRARMAGELALALLRTGDRTPLRVLRLYRALRERLGDEGETEFETKLRHTVAERLYVPLVTVDLIVAEWIDRRPLRHLRAARFFGLAELFRTIGSSGRAIGVVSDYPAASKLVALGLTADRTISAEDVGRLKPHPLGLQTLIAACGVTIEQAVLIGDRAERDGEAARRAGVRCLIRSRRRIPGYRTFRTFNDPLFAGLKIPAQF